MELSSIELHIFVSVAVILGSALVALVVDYLKGNNEQLREHNIELRVRREEESRRSLGEIRLLREGMQASAAKPAPAGESSRKIIERAVQRAALNGNVESAPAPAVAAPRPATERLSQPGQRKSSRWWEEGGVPSPPLGNSIEEPAPEVVREAPPPEAPPSGSLLEHIIASMPFGAESAALAPESIPEVIVVEQVAVAECPASEAETSRVVWVTPLVETPAAPEPPVAGELPLPVPSVEDSQLISIPETRVEPGAFAAAAVLPQPLEAEAPAPAATSFIAPGIEPARGDVGPAMSAPAAAQLPQPEPRISASTGLKVEGEPARSLGPVLVQRQLSLPAGFVQAEAVEEALTSNGRLTGVTVAVSVQNSGKSGAGKQDPASAVETLLRGLLGPEDLAYRNSGGEFILILPNEKGGAASRRIQRISEKLWDLQLRSLTAQPITLHWGAATVDGEILSEAVSLAMEELIETRDNRRNIGMDNFRPRRRAVNY